VRAEHATLLSRRLPGEREARWVRCAFAPRQHARALLIQGMSAQGVPTNASPWFSDTLEQNPPARVLEGRPCKHLFGR
jgi:hypothetical protein